MSPCAASVYHSLDPSWLAPEIFRNKLLKRDLNILAYCINSSNLVLEPVILICCSGHGYCILEDGSVFLSKAALASWNAVRPVC